MHRNKPRLQLALYARPKHPGSYHYAIFVTPKNSVKSGPATKHHVLNTLQTNEAGEAVQPWRYEHTEIPDIEAERRLLIRVVVAKVAKPVSEIQRVVETVPIRQVDEVGHDDGVSTFSCQTWIRDVLSELSAEGVITGLEPWEVVQLQTLHYLEWKKHQGRWNGFWEDASAVPLMDLLEKRQIVA